MTLQNLTKKYRFKIRLIKFICIILTIFLSISFLFVVRTYNLEHKLSLKLSDQGDKNQNIQNDLQITKARFHSTTNDDQPFEIYADKILQLDQSKFLLTEIDVILSQTKEHKITLNSNQALWFEKEKLFELIGDINIEVDKEYIIESKNAILNLNNKTLDSKDKVKIIGKGYELNAMGIEYKKDNNKINFLGPISLKTKI